MSNDQDIATLCSITACTTNEAEHYLAAANHDLNAAIVLCMDNQPSQQVSKPAPAQEARIRQPIEYSNDTLINEGSASIFHSTMNSTPTNPFASGPGKSDHLAALFAPPYDIMFQGGGINAAKKHGKYLIITIHDSNEFACQTMNRDLWSNDNLKTIIKESFTFLQITQSSAEGQRYISYYHMSSLPHVAIIDWKTGERIKCWDRKVESHELIEYLIELTSKSQKKKIKQHISMEVKPIAYCLRPSPTETTRLQIRSFTGKRRVIVMETTASVSSLFAEVKAFENLKTPFELTVLNKKLGECEGMTLKEAKVENCVIFTVEI